MEPDNIVPPPGPVLNTLTKEEVMAEYIHCVVCGTQCGYGHADPSAACSRACAVQAEAQGLEQPRCLHCNKVLHRGQEFCSVRCLALYDI